LSTEELKMERHNMSKAMEPITLTNDSTVEQVEIATNWISRSFQIETRLLSQVYMYKSYTLLGYPDFKMYVNEELTVGYDSALKYARAGVVLYNIFGNYDHCGMYSVNSLEPFFKLEHPEQHRVIWKELQRQLETEKPERNEVTKNVVEAAISKIFPSVKRPTEAKEIPLTDLDGVCVNFEDIGLQDNTNAVDSGSRCNDGPPKLGNSTIQQSFSSTKYAHLSGKLDEEQLTILRTVDSLLPDKNVPKELAKILVSMLGKDKLIRILQKKNKGKSRSRIFF